MILVMSLTTVVLIAIACIAVSNALAFVRLRITRGSSYAGTVSVLIPARNEEAVIEGPVSSLREQSYPQFEVIVLDDDSSDFTAEAVLQAAGQDPRVQLVSGQPLPEGWSGKNWACHQLSDLAHGEYLLFTDADVHWEPNALSAIMAVMLRTRADALAVWPTQITRTWGERLVVPLMAMTVLGYLPCLFVHHLRFDSMAAAIGQCLVFRADIYESIGGHLAIKDMVMDDMMLVRRVKAHRYRLRTVDAAGLLTCRMYRNWPEVRDGFSKNILAGHGNSVLLLSLSALFHWVVFLLPWVWVLAGPMTPVAGWPWWPLLLICLGVGVRALTAATSGQRCVDALLLPVSVLLMTWIAALAVWRRWRFGGVSWKGRSV